MNALLKRAEKAQYLAGFEPTTSLSHGVCSYAVQQPQPFKSLLNAFTQRYFCLREKDQSNLSKDMHEQGLTFHVQDLPTKQV